MTTDKETDDSNLTETQSSDAGAETVAATGDEAAAAAQADSDAGEPVPETRKDRRAAYQRATEKAKAESERAAKAEKAAAEAAERIAALTGQISQLTSATQETLRMQRAALPKPEDPHAAKLKELRAEKNKVLASLKENPENIEKYHDLEEQIADVRADMRIAAQRAEERKNAAPQMSREEAAIVGEFPWMQEDEDAPGVANAIAKRLSKGKDLSNPAVKMAVMRQAAIQTGIQLGHPVSKKTDTATGAGRVAGSGNGAADSGSNGVDSMPPPNDFRMALAMARFPSDDPDVAYTKWWKSTQAGIKRRAQANG